MSESWLFVIRVVWMSICAFGLAVVSYGLRDAWLDWKAQAYDARVERLFGRRKGRVVQAKGALRSSFVYLVSVIVLTALSAYSIFAPPESRTVPEMAASTLLLITMTISIFVNSVCIQKDRHDIRQSIDDVIVTDTARYGPPVTPDEENEDEEE